MKNIISNSLQKVLLIIFVLAINLTNLFAQANPKLQAIVMFEKNIITLPHGNTEADVNELKIKSFEVKNIFSKYNARFIRKAFPLFSPNDTLVIASTGEQVKLADLSNIYLFDFSDTNSVSEFINDIKGLTEVIYAEPNYHDFRTQGFPNDPHYENGDLWGLNNYGQNGGTTDADIDAPEAWQITQGSETVKVGIIDTGVEITHDDLNGKSTGDLPESYYSYGHGTHVAGIVGAKNNGGEVKGVSPNTSIVSRKVFSGVDYYGRALWAGDNNAYSKIMAAINEGCSILNHSYGGPNYSTTLRIAFANITKFNRSSTVSMGNSNSSSLSYPAAFGQGIIAVGSTDNFDLRSQDNTPGYEWGSNFGNHIDVTAPGGKYAFINDKNILSTWPGNSYLKISGTSMASPVVSGIASLLKAYNSNLFNDDIEQIIRISAEDKGDPGWDQYYGTGRVNAYNALRLLQAPYQLSQLSVSSGSIHSGTNNYALTIYGASGLQDGTYWVKRYEIRKSLSFPHHFEHNVWGRGLGNGVSGWNNDSPKNFAMGYSEIVPGTITSNTAVVRTYLYEIWKVDGLGQTQYLGWFPTTPQNVSFNYTVLGKPLVAPVIASITQDPVPIYKGTNGYVYCNLAQGNGNLTYNWFSTNQPSYITIVPEGYRCKIIYPPTESIPPIDAPTWVYRHQ